MHFDEASWITLERRPGETLRGALERELRAAILDGSLRAGARLPSSRVLARTIGVSRGVTSDAYGQLEAQGSSRSRRAASPIVASVERGVRPAPGRAPEPQPRFDFIPTTPDVTLFPRRLFASALAEAARTATAAALDYGDPAGLPELRLALADHLGLTRGVVTTPDQIVITQGTAQAVDLVLRVLRARGRGVTVEDPSLVSQQRRVASHGLEVIGQPVDARGLVVDGLRGDAVIVMPAHQFPTGTVLRGDRRRATRAVGARRRPLPDRGRLRRRVPLRPGRGARAPGPRARPRRLPRHHLEDPRTRPADGLDRSPAGARRRAARRRRTCSTPARPRCPSSRSRGCCARASTRATSGECARSTGAGATC